MLPAASSVRRIDRIGASPVPPASSSSGASDSRRKKLPCGPVKLIGSPTWARDVRYSDITPPGVILTRKVSAASSGALLNEYERDSSVPGTAMLTYWPGRNVSAARSSISIVSATVVGESRSSPVTVPWWVAALVFATAEVVAICSTRSERGFMLQGSTKPARSSSGDSASSRKVPPSNVPDSQNALQVPHAPSRQSSGMLIRAR